MTSNHATITTAQAGKVLGLSGHKVNRLVDSGKLKGFRIPASNHRRVLKRELINFAEDHGIPMDWTAIGDHETHRRLNGE